MFAYKMLVMLSGLAAFALQNIYLIHNLADVRATPRDLYNKKWWHFFGGVQHVWMGFAISQMFGWEFGLLSGSYGWLIFDGLVNKYGLYLNFFYVGTTAGIDKLQQLIAAKLHVEVEKVSFVIKATLVIISTVIAIIYL